METIKNLKKDEIVKFSMEIPKNYHCNCRFCRGTFFGEIKDPETGKFYTNSLRKLFYGKDESHLDKGQFIGYRFAAQKFCPEGGWVFDPTVGTGTAVVEAINNGRNGVGIELEWPDLAKDNVKMQNSEKTGIIIPGNAKDLNELLEPYDFEFDLVVNGTPYFTNAQGISSDAPMTKKEKGEKPDNYEAQGSFGLLRENTWEIAIEKMYKDSAKFLKKGGRLIIIIKDMMRNHKAYNLHGQIGDLILRNPDMEYEGFFIHRHLPKTFFINMQLKRDFDDFGITEEENTRVPLYQTGLVFKKK